jgi:tetratricopeptide (TPR) repeat protein
VLGARGFLDDAISAYSTALSLQPEDPGWLAERADVHAANGDATAASADLERALSLLKADDPDIYGRALSRLLSDHRLDPAMAVSLAEADWAKRKDLLGRDTYAWALYRVGRHDEAAAIIAPAVEAGLQDAEVRFHAGLILQASDDIDGARELLRDVLDTNPGFHPLFADEARQALQLLP